MATSAYVPGETRFCFDRLQRWLHWTMAVLIFVAIGLGIASAYFPVGQQPRKGLLEIHKSIGFTIVILLMVRLAWRGVAGEPPYRQPLDRFTRAASRVGHAAFYALMILMPVTGYSSRQPAAIRRRGLACSSGRACCPIKTTSSVGESGCMMASRGW